MPEADTPRVRRLGVFAKKTSNRRPRRGVETFVAEHSDEALFREINDELRQENFAKFWKAYGAYILGLSIAIILGVAAFQGWKAYDTHRREKYGESLHTAFVQAARGNTDAAIKDLRALADKAGGGYAMIARFKEAALLAHGKDPAKAIAIYDSISANTALDPLYRDIATLEGAQTALNLSATDGAAVIKHIEPIEAADNPLRFTARELHAAYALKAGDRKKAHELFKAIATDASAPQSLRARAQELAAALAES